MDFWRTVVVLFRRWYITVPAFALTLLAAGAAYSVAPVQYQSDGVLVLTTPLSGGSKSSIPSQNNVVTNPMTNFDTSLGLAASIVLQELSSAEAVHELGVTPGDTTTFAVDNGTTNPELLESGPFIFVHGLGPSAQAAQDIAQRVANLAGVILDERQNELNAPQSTHIGIQVVVPPGTGQPLLSSPMRAAAAVAALAGMASLAAVYAFESLMTHRRRRREEKKRAAAGAPLRDGPAHAERRRAPNPEAGSATASHRVNGTSVRPAPSGAVDVLESGRPEAP
jgi:hypothetical protein